MSAPKRKAQELKSPRACGLDYHDVMLLLDMALRDRDTRDHFKVAGLSDPRSEKYYARLEKLIEWLSGPV